MEFSEVYGETWKGPWSDSLPIVLFEVFIGASRNNGFIGASRKNNGFFGASRNNGQGVLTERPL